LHVIIGKAEMRISVIGPVTPIEEALHTIQQL